MREDDGIPLRGSQFPRSSIIGGWIVAFALCLIVAGCSCAIAVHGQ